MLRNEQLLGGVHALSNITLIKPLTSTSNTGYSLYRPWTKTIPRHDNLGQRGCHVTDDDL